MTDRYIYLSLRMKDCPPVGNQTLEFSPGLNVIAGRNGSGKTSVIHALRTKHWPNGGEVSVVEEGDHDVIALYWPLVEVSQFGENRGAGRPELHWTRLAHANESVRTRAASILVEMIRSKLGASQTKFAQIPYCGQETFALEVSIDGDVVVHAGRALQEVTHESPYGSVEQLFVAMGERGLLNLSGILSARDHLNLDLPLIIDDAFDLLDEYHRAGLSEIIQSIDQQIIVTLNDYSLDKMRGSLADFNWIELRTP